MDGNAFARLTGTVASRAGGNLTQGLEVAPPGVIFVRDGAQTLQLQPVQPVTIAARLPDGAGFTAQVVARWVRGGW